MKHILRMSAAALALGLVAGAPGNALAQSDRTMGINCTEAGHVHCGETGPIFGSQRWQRHHRYRTQRTSQQPSSQRQVIRDEQKATTGAAQNQPQTSGSQTQTTVGSGTRSNPRVIDTRKQPAQNDGAGKN